MISTVLRRLRSGWTKLDRSRIVDGAIVLTIGLVALWLYSPLSTLRFNPYDLGIDAYGAARVLDGFVPYADMHTPYGPAEYYVDALLFSLFGTSIEVMGVERVVMKAVFVAVGYWVFRGCVTRGLAILMTMIFVTLVSGGMNSVAYVAMLFATGCMVRYAHRQNARWLIAAGAAIGFVWAVRWDFGLYCGFVFAIALVSLPFVRHAAAPAAHEPVRLRVHAQRFVALLVPAAVVTLHLFTRRPYSSMHGLYSGLSILR
jgi:hypothetical protein